MYCKDTESVHTFCRQWHENWMFSNRPGYRFDQLPLYMTCVKNPGAVTEIGGEYNCMITVGIRYLVDAKIMHFFSASNTTFTPFKNMDTYLKIKEEGDISEAMQKLILNCKREFGGPLLIMDKDDIHTLYHQPLFQLIKSMKLKVNTIGYKIVYKTLLLIHSFCSHRYVQAVKNFVTRKNPNCQ